ncbi:MAG: hypothetical protein LH618_05470, partial [Saprospiraceae bacterium]|nr:hypothetical protein [Saprospiraceae bacterium]
SCAFDCRSVECLTRIKNNASYKSGVGELFFPNMGNLKNKLRALLLPGTDGRRTQWESTCAKKP